MGILSISLFILKIIGIILAIILILLLVLLFSAIKLKAKVSKYEEFVCYAKVTYIFGIISFVFDQNRNIADLKIFGINIEKFTKNAKTKKNQKAKKQKDENIVSEEEQVIYTASPDTIKDKPSENPDKQDGIKPNEQKKSALSQETKQEEYEADETEPSQKNKKNFKEKTNKFKDIKEKIKFIINYKDKKLITKLCLELVKGLIKAVKIKKLKADIEYGFDDPYKTGCICGCINAIIPLIPIKYIKNIKAVPDFEEEVLEGKIELVVKTSIFRILVPIIKFILKEPIKKIIFRKGE